MLSLAKRHVYSVLICVCKCRHIVSGYQLSRTVLELIS